MDTIMTLTPTSHENNMFFPWFSTLFVSKYPFTQHLLGSASFQGLAYQNKHIQGFSHIVKFDEITEVYER